MSLWDCVIDKKDIVNSVVGKTYQQIKEYIDSKEKNYSFNNYDNSNNCIVVDNYNFDCWTVFINEYNLYDKIIHSYKLFFNDDTCIKVEKRY